MYCANPTYSLHKYHNRKTQQMLYCCAQNFPLIGVFSFWANIDFTNGTNSVFGRLD